MDGLFEKAGFAPERVVECHGNLRRVQCCSNPQHGVWRSESVLKNLRLSHPATSGMDNHCSTAGTSTGQDGDTEPRALPTMLTALNTPLCRAFRCKSAARPNVLLFGDIAFNGALVEKQLKQYTVWLQTVFSTCEIHCQEHKPGASGDNSDCLTVHRRPGDSLGSGSRRSGTGTGSTSATQLASSMHQDLGKKDSFSRVDTTVSPTPTVAHSPRSAQVLLLEIGAGAVVPTVREQTQSVYLDAVAHGCDVAVIRLNTEDGAEERRFVGNPDHFRIVRQRADTVLSLLHS